MVFSSHLLSSWAKIKNTQEHRNTQEYHIQLMDQETTENEGYIYTFIYEENKEQGELIN